MRTERRHAVWLILATFHFVVVSIFRLLAAPALVPFRDVEGHTVAAAIQRFGGHEPGFSWEMVLVRSLAGLVVSFMIAPALLAWGVADWSRSGLSDRNGRLRLRPFAATSIGGALTLGWLLVALFVAATRPPIEWKKHQRSRHSASRDLLMMEASLVAQKSRAAFLVPVDEGGLGRHWPAGSRGEVPSDFIDEVTAGSALHRQLAMIRSDLTDVSYAMTVAGTDTLVIRATGQRRHATSQVVEARAVEGGIRVGIVSGPVR